MSGDSNEVTVTVVDQAGTPLANSVQTTPGEPRTAPDHGNRWWARGSEDGLPEGVLRKIGPAMTGTITAVAIAAGSTWPASSARPCTCR
jgi:hypothetical protein